MPELWTNHLESPFDNSLNDYSKYGDLTSIYGKRSGLENYYGKRNIVDEPKYSVYDYDPAYYVPKRYFPGSFSTFYMTKRQNQQQEMKRGPHDEVALKRFSSFYSK